MKDPAHATKIFEEKCKIALAKIPNQDEFRAMDKMIDFVFATSHELYKRDLDVVDEGWLIRKGGRLTSVYAYLGNVAARTRAERDIFEQKIKEVRSELMEDYLDSDYKVTQVKSIIDGEVSEIVDLLTLKELDKNNIENLMSAIDKMVSFIQSALRMKLSEKYKGNSMQDNN